MSSSAEPLRVAVLLSGRGSNLRALIAGASDDASFHLVGAFSDRPEAPGLQHAREAGLPTAAFAPRDYPDKGAFERALFDAVTASGAELVVLAGFMRVLSAPTVEAWRGRLINIHPSLLPKYPGLHTHARVLEAGDAEHGASVHFVTAVLDGGPVLMQVRIPVRPGDDAEVLAARLIVEEHRLLLAAVRLIARRRVRLDGEQILIDGQRLTAPMLVPAAP